MFGSFAAIGDSFTEGLDDARADGSFRGWADLVATHLAAHAAQAGSAPFRYANLAVRGRLLGQIVEDQLPPALALQPDLLSLAGGTNDLLRRHCDPVVLARRLHTAALQVAETSSARLVLFTGVDPSGRLPVMRRLRPRVVALNEGVRWAASDSGAVLVELWPERVFDDPRVWSVDRLHLNADGHRRVAAAVVEALGLPFEVTGAHALPAEWREPLPAGPPVHRTVAALEDARWARTHLVPWLHRRVTGRSSGDTVTPKRPALEPYDATVS